MLEEKVFGDSLANHSSLASSVNGFLDAKTLRHYCRSVREKLLSNFPDYVRAAGLALAASRSFSETLLGTCAKVNGSIEYEARPLESERIAVA